MQIKYRRTFSQFIDNYLASYYSAGVQTFRRIVGGPLTIAVGVSLINFGRRPNSLGFVSALLWIIGLVFLSQGALLVALFSHVYIWVHYYTTELPDMRRIYGAD